MRSRVFFFLHIYIYIYIKTCCTSNIVFKCSLGLLLIFYVMKETDCSKKEERKLELNGEKNVEKFIEYLYLCY